MPLPEAIATLIPHAGSMCLHERVVSWDAERIALATATHRDPANPLRRDGALHALHLCEYGAQAMAIHGGLCAQAAGSHAAPGLLVALRDVKLHVQRIDVLEGELRIEAERLLESADSWQYAFRAWHGERLLAEGRAAVMVRPAEGSLQEPRLPRPSS
jgi:predicted hotdog family 3-hydroxylacyl-ACP dehydratase